MKFKDRNPATSPNDKGGGELGSFGNKDESFRRF
jgi:hypothetical protein